MIGANRNPILSVPYCCSMKRTICMMHAEGTGTYLSKAFVMESREVFKEEDELTISDNDRLTPLEADSTGSNRG